MGCIARILELKGEKEYMEAPDNTNVIIEDGGKYKGYEYLTIINATGFRCGYVAIPQDHDLYNFQKNYDAFLYYPDLDVHGGVTFFGEQHLIESDCNDKWIGFDCGHAGDAWDYDTAIRYFRDVGNNENAESIEHVRKIRNECGVAQYSAYETIKTKDFVIGQCKHLIDQLAS